MDLAAGPLEAQWSSPFPDHIVSVLSEELAFSQTVQFLLCEANVPSAKLLNVMNPTQPACLEYSPWVTSGE